MFACIFQISFGTQGTLKRIFGQALKSICSQAGVYRQSLDSGSGLSLLSSRCPSFASVTSSTRGSHTPADLSSETLKILEVY